MASSKNAPSFNPEADDYASWKSDVEVWRLLTDIKPEKIGPAVYLALQGKARDIVRTVPLAEIGTEQGFDTVIAKLDAVYKKDEAATAFSAFTDFYEFRRESGQDFASFIVDYEKRYFKVKNSSIGELPEGVQAFFLLKNANLTLDSEKLVRATASLDYADMKEKIMKVFGDPGVLNNSDLVPDVKEEAFYGYGYEGRRGKWNQPSRGRGRGRGQGLRSRACFGCGDTSHLVKDCPKRQEKTQEVFEQGLNVHVTLVSSKPEGPQQGLLMESLCKGVLDSGCSKSVAGELWYREYIATLTEKQKSLIKERASKSVFRFGDGAETRSSKVVTLPVMIGSHQCSIEIEIVENSLPLLISRDTMKELGMTLDFVNDIVFVKGEKVKLYCTKSGQYCVSLSPVIAKEAKVVLHCNLEGLTADERKRKALKLHRQFAHATSHKLTKMLKESGCADKDFLRCVEEICELCQLFKRAPLKPAVGLRLSDKFNGVVCLDLKEYARGEYILHLIDAFTRYSSAAIIKTKKKDLVVESIFKTWIRYFGAPRKMLNDNGGEFANSVMIEMHEQLGIETCTTAGEAPWSNGLVERHHAPLVESMLKTMDDTKCDAEMALAWAVAAKNALHNEDGFSANQLVFGFNVNLPSVITSSPPALKTTLCYHCRTRVRDKTSSRKMVATT